jgi:hypothetical protein
MPATSVGDIGKELRFPLQKVQSLRDYLNFIRDETAHHGNVHLWAYSMVGVPDGCVARTLIAQWNSRARG